MSNEITAYFKGRTGVAESVYQYDYGRVLVIDGIDLPALFEVHFNTLAEDDSVAEIGQNNRVTIPNKCLEKPGTVTAHIYLHSGDNDGETEYTLKFGVIRRVRPDYDEEDKKEWETAASKALAMLQNSRKVNTPLDERNQVTNGIAGQLLRTNGNGSTEWVFVGTPTDEQTEAAVNAWLDEHPEATTTVQDGAITVGKLASDLKYNLDEISYYKEITVEKNRYNHTDYYVVTIPVTDTAGETIKPYVAYSNEYTPLQYAQENGTTLTTNSCISMKPESGGTWLRGNIIGAGEVLFSQDISEELVSKATGYLTISEDRSVVKDYPITTKLATLQADSDVWNCMTYYCPLLKNGTEVDNTGIVTNEGADITIEDTQMSIGVKPDNTLIIIGCEGRTNYNKGLSTFQLAELYTELGCSNAWLLDGGGSSNITVKGSKINRNYDGKGTEDRNIHFTLNVKKDTAIKSYTDTFKKIGEEKQRLIQQIMAEINAESVKNKTESDVDLDTISETSFKYILRAVNAPNGVSSFGYCITIARTTGIEMEDIRQIWTSYNTPNVFYMRECENAVWGDWYKFSGDVAEGETFDIIGNFAGLVDGSRIYFSIPANVRFTKTSGVTAEWADNGGVQIQQNGHFLAGSTTKIKPTIGYVRAYKNVGIDIRLDIGSALTNDDNYVNLSVVGLSIAHLNITL